MLAFKIYLRYPFLPAVVKGYAFYTGSIVFICATRYAFGDCSVNRSIYGCLSVATDSAACSVAVV